MNRHTCCFCDPIRKQPLEKKELCHGCIADKADSTAVGNGVSAKTVGQAKIPSSGWFLKRTYAVCKCYKIIQNVPTHLQGKKIRTTGWWMKNYLDWVTCRTRTSMSRFGQYVLCVVQVGAYSSMGASVFYGSFMNIQNGFEKSQNCSKIWGKKHNCYHCGLAFRWEPLKRAHHGSCRVAMPTCSALGNGFTGKVFGRHGQFVNLNATNYRHMVGRTVSISVMNIRNGDLSEISKVLICLGERNIPVSTVAQIYFLSSASGRTLRAP